MKVNKNKAKIRTTFPPESQNSDSPYALTARMLTALFRRQVLACTPHRQGERGGHELHGGTARGESHAACIPRFLRIAENDGSTDTSNRTGLSHHRAPKGQHQGKGRDLKGNQQGFIETTWGASVSSITNTNSRSTMRASWALEGGAQEVPANHEAERVVYPFTSQSYEAATDGVCGAHLGDAVVDHG